MQLDRLRLLAAGSTEPEWRAETLDIVRALKRLPPRMRMCVVLAYLEDQSTASVAEALGCTPKTVENQLREGAPPAPLPYRRNLGDREMDDQGPIEIEEARMRRLLQHAAGEIGGSQPQRSQVKHNRGRRSAAVVAVTVVALAASAGTGFAFGRSAPTNPTSSVRLASLPTEPPLVEAALQALYQQRDPEIVQRVNSVEVKYVTDQEFWHAISYAGKLVTLLFLRDLLRSVGSDRSLVRCRFAWKIRLCRVRRCGFWVPRLL